MEIAEGPNDDVTAATGAGGGAADVNPSHHEEAEQHVDNEDRRTRIMELAQQQQMTIQLLDEVVANQRNLQENQLRRRRRQRNDNDNDDDDGLMGHQEEEHP